MDNPTLVQQKLEEELRVGAKINGQVKNLQQELLDLRRDMRWVSPVFVCLH